MRKSPCFFQWVGPSCGHHASYAFYKAIRYTHKKTGAPKILSLGEFFFVKGRTFGQTGYSAVTSFG